MKILLITEPNKALIPGMDTSVLLAEELLLRNIRVDYCDYAELDVSLPTQQYLSQLPIAPIQRVIPGAVNPLQLSSQKQLVPAEQYHAILQRMDPPVDKKYQIHCQHFIQLDKRTVQLNRPEWTWRLSEHLLPRDYPESSIPTTECNSFESFLNQIRSSRTETVAKPSNFFGGEGIAFFKPETPIEALKKHWENWGPVLVTQPYQDLITKVGDLRILVMNCKVVGAVLRKPKDGSRLANLHQGGSPHPFDPTKEQLKVVEKAAKDLYSKGLYLLGFDFIGNLLSEINITCPTTVPQINQVMGIRGQQLIIDELMKLIRCSNENNC